MREHSSDHGAFREEREHSHRTATRWAREWVHCFLIDAPQELGPPSAADAAAIVNSMLSLADQLIAGADANSDGRITWEQGEGGLQLADEQVTLRLGVR